MDIVMNHTGYNTVADMEEFGFGTLLDGATDFKYKLTDVGEVNDHIDYKTSEEDYERYEKVDSGEVDSISYVIVREVI